MSCQSARSGCDGYWSHRHSQAAFVINSIKYHQGPLVPPSSGPSATHSRCCCSPPIWSVIRGGPTMLDGTGPGWSMEQCLLWSVSLSRSQRAMRQLDVSVIWDGIGLLGFLCLLHIYGTIYFFLWLMIPYTCRLYTTTSAWVQNTQSSLNTASDTTPPVYTAMNRCSTCNICFNQHHYKQRRRA